MKGLLKFIFTVFLVTTISATVYAQRSDSNPRKLGKQLVKTDNYILYAASGNFDQCMKYTPYFVLVYDVSPNYVFEPNGFIDLAIQTFETKCSGINLKEDQLIGLSIYLKDIRITKNDDSYEINGTTEDYEYPFLDIGISRNKYTNFEWRVNTFGGSALDASEKPWSLETLEKKIEKRKQDLAKSKIEAEKDRIAEKKYQAEAPQRAAVAAKKRIVDERNLSASVLRLIKPNAPKKYNFAGYSNQKVLENIYNGQFDSFVSRKELDDAVFEAERARNNIDPRLALEMLANMIQSGTKLALVKERYTELASYYFGYHNVYFELCQKNKEIPWVTGEIYKFWLTKNGKFVEGSERFGYSGSIREPYKETHKETYELLAQRLETKPQISEEKLSDFRKFLQAEGCSSPTVRDFEANLYLATNLRLPLQILYDPLLIKPDTKPNAESEPKIVPKKTEAKTAPKKRTHRKN